MAHKNDYSVVVFTEDGTPKKWQYVHNLGGFTSFLNKTHSTWKYFNVYDRRKGTYLKRFYKGNFVPAFLSFLILALISPLNSTFNNPSTQTNTLNSTFNSNSVGLHFFLTFNNTSTPITFNNDFNNTATIPTSTIRGGDAIC